MIEMKRQLSNDNEIMQASKLICTSMHSLVAQSTFKKLQ